jgi:AAHS family 4-hydroxybenzoate transporter-like MFS transporter
MLDAGRISPHHLWLVLLTALAIIFDGIDNQLLGIAIPALSADWGVTRAAFAPVVALNSLGMMVGGAAAGFIGDRAGRRTALAGSLALFGIVTMAVAFVNGPSGLSALRFLTGLGLGGALPNAATLAAEYVPVRHRPLAVTMTIVCVPVGGTLAGIIWRGLFAVGGAAPVVLGVLLARALPESPRFLSNRPERHRELAAALRRMGHQVDPDATFAVNSPSESRRSIRTLFGDDMRLDTFALWAAFFSCLLAVYLAFSWLPSILAAAGHGTAAASGSLTVFNLGGVVGAVAGGWVISRVGSKTAMLFMTAGAVAGAATLGLIDIRSPGRLVELFGILAVTGGLINAVQVTMYALAAHVYPTAVRATGVGVAVAIGRGGAILSGAAGPIALDYRGTASFFGLMAATLAVTFVALAVVRRHIPPPPKRD